MNKNIKIEKVLLVLFTLFILTSNNHTYGRAYCEYGRGGPFCDNGATPTCPNGLTSTCTVDEFQRLIPACCASVSLQSCNFFILCPDPQPAPTPLPPTQPITPIPTTSTCNASALLLTCNAQGTSANFVTCTCNASSNPIIPTVTPSTSSVMCAAGLTACPNATTPNFQCCQNGCDPFDPSQCRSDYSTAPTPPPTFEPELVISAPELINLSNNPKTFDLTVTGLNFPSVSNCSVSTVNTNLRMKFIPTNVSLGIGKSSEAIKVLVRNSRALTKTNLITIKATCRNGSTDEIGINVLP